MSSMPSVEGQRGPAGNLGSRRGQRSLRVLLVSGIYPPDIGGPATHVVDLANELSERGHRTTTLALWGQSTVDRQSELVRFPRRWPWAVRTAAIAAWILRHRHDYDVVYATGLHLEAVVGGRLARRPVIVKIVGDPAWERGRRLGLTSLEFDEFQRPRPQTPMLRVMCALRDWSVRAATEVIAPSQFLADCVEGWRGKPGVRVIPNGVRTRHERPPQTRTGPLERVVVVSRLAEHKRIDVVIEGVAHTSDLQLEIVGDGPDRERLEDLTWRLGMASRVVFAGSVNHDEVLTRLAQADALVSASSYEGLPHVVIEALSIGTPVITSAPGGVREALGGGIGGVIVDPPTVEGFSRILAELHADPRRMRELREGALALGKQWDFSTCADRVESLLLETAA